jgi:hypothetical protein
MYDEAGRSHALGLVWEAALTGFNRLVSIALQDEV